MDKKESSGQGAPFLPQNTSFSAKMQEEEKSQQQNWGMQFGEGYQVQQQGAIDRSQQMYTQPAKARASIFSGAFFKGQSRTRLGFTAAGICISAGAILLMIVFVIAQSLPTSVSTEVQAASQNKENKVAAVVTPIPQPSPSPTAVNATPTPDMPGSKYIDNIQIGPAINMNKVEIVQQTRDFQPGQRIYITMKVNSAGYQGAVCLDWYVQNAFLTHYAFPTTADPTLPYSTAWSYATSIRPGPGYVNVSWASSIACADKVLAQKVDFNVGG